MSDRTVSIGTKVTGIVTHLQDFYATVKLDGELGYAIIHLAQLSNNFLTPPMSTHLSVADRLGGIIVGFDSKTGYPEMSTKKLLRLETKDCVTLRANEVSTLVETPNGPGILFNIGGHWSRYEVLYTSGLLNEGQHLALLSKGVLDESGRRIMHFPVFPYLDGRFVADT